MTQDQQIPVSADLLAEIGDDDGPARRTERNLTRDAVVDAVAAHRAGVRTAENLPTVAGLLALGVYPQQFFPRFVINLAAHTDASVRAQHASTLTGPIPVMLDSELAWARQGAAARTNQADQQGQALPTPPRRPPTPRSSRRRLGRSGGTSSNRTTT